MATSQLLARRTLDMGLGGFVLALFTCGYILGVWTAFVVLRQPQRAYEEGVPVSLSVTGAMVAGATGIERRL
ncbi:MAG: hypothetical protein ABI959_06470 [Candidatus Dormiibacterota bacterium]